jgi:hypothetical protein
MSLQRGKRVLVCSILALIGVFRPGVDALDRWLVSRCWSVPSLWNAVAEIAIRQGVVETSIEGRRASFRRACVLLAVPSRLAVVVVSDMRRARITVVDEEYRVRGVFERKTSNPDLITDEARGYMPLSHLWPVHDWYGDSRLVTLVALEPTHSEPLGRNVFAFLALGPESNELLFACRLRGKQYSGEVVLDRVDADADGFADLVVSPYPASDLDHGAHLRPWALFRWDPAARSFQPHVRDGAETVLSYWHGTPAERVFFGRQESLDERVRQLVDSGGATGAGASPPLAR